MNNSSNFSPRINGRGDVTLNAISYWIQNVLMCHGYSHSLFAALTRVRQPSRLPGISSLNEPVFDLKSNTRIHSIGAFGEPHNVRYLPDSNKLLVVDGGAGEVKFLKGDSYKPMDSAKLLEGADSAVFDLGSGYLYVAAGGKDAHLDYSNLAITDTKEDKHLGDIRIESPILEAMALETSGPRMFVIDTANGHVLV